VSKIMFKNIVRNMRIHPQ